MSEQSNRDEQPGTEAGEGRWKARQEQDDVEGHKFAPRDEGVPTDEGEGRRPTPYSDDDEPDVEAHRWGHK
jgi:hypothetical protein